jgi:hypothetical protein
MNKLTMAATSRTKTTTKVVPMIAIVALLAAIAGADAAPNIPSSELPGRERQRFQESPIDRFTQPQQQSEPLWRWECEPPKNQKRKHSRSASKRC